MSVLKKPNKPQKNRFEVVFFWVLLGGYFGRVFYCQPWDPGGKKAPDPGSATLG
jgi:hypothetical protein